MIIAKDKHFIIIRFFNKEYDLIHINCLNRNGTPAFLIHERYGTKLISFSTKCKKRPSKKLRFLWNSITTNV